jgi:IS5 family transposase
VRTSNSIRNGQIRTWKATDAAGHDGLQLPDLIDKQNTASDVWADTAYCSAKNEEHLAKRRLRSQIHRKKPKGKRMPEAVARANARKSRVRAGVEHVFARQKVRWGFRTIVLAGAKVKIGLANLTYNMKRMLWLTTRLAMA